jgi:hypothetical protein
MVTDFSKKGNLTGHFAQGVLHMHEGGTLEVAATRGQEARVNFGIPAQGTDTVNPAALPASTYDTLG